MEGISSLKDEFDVETLETIARLSQRKDFILYVEVMEQVRDKAEHNLARKLLKDRRPLDQREVDREQGGWDRVDFFARRFPDAVIRELKRLHNEEPEERE